MSPRHDRDSRPVALFQLDRPGRFLTEYRDPAVDDEIASAVLDSDFAGAANSRVVPAISLEYYFSVWNFEGYGFAVRKLPHNVASMLGVMTAARAAILRSGVVPTCMIEIL